MKNTIKLASIMFMMSSATLFAQKDTSDWETNSNYNRMYDVKTVTEIKGQVIAVEQVVPIQGMSFGIHITVKTASETISVHLGPKWYLDKQTIQIKKGDEVIVKGSNVLLDGKRVIIAKEINKGANILNLRDENGIPNWAGKRQR